MLAVVGVSPTSGEALDAVGSRGPRGAAPALSGRPGRVPGVSRRVQGLGCWCRDDHLEGVAPLGPRDRQPTTQRSRGRDGQGHTRTMDFIQPYG
jgi:hypothetical protein